MVGYIDHVLNAMARPNLTLYLIKMMHIDSKQHWIYHFQWTLSRCPFIYLVIFVDIKIIAKFNEISKNRKTFCYFAVKLF